MMWTAIVRRGVFACCLAAATMSAHAETKPDPPTLRRQLADWGIDFNATYISEGFGDASGGMRRGATYTGRLDVGATINLERLMGWTGATFHANLFQIHGGGLSRDYVGNLMLVSGVEALPATRAYELWIEQSLLRDRLAIRIGQQAADVEFFDSRYDDVFANSALGWPGITGINLPGGGPSPPLAVPGVRVKATLSEQLAAYVAVFDGYPASPGTGDAQIGNPHGVLFRVNDPPWVVGQLRYGFDAGKGHPAKIVVGGWKHFGSFDDMRFGANGRLLADPLSFGLARKLNGNWGLYAVYEQLLTPAVAGSDNGIGFFFRASASPGDRNLISLYLDGGFEFIGVGSARPNDKIGIGVTYARISDSARQADSDIAIMTGSAFPRRDYEAVIELTYAAQVSEHCVMQPIFEYVIHPGGGILNPYAPAQRIKNAAVFGFRTTITY